MNTLEYLTSHNIQVDVKQTLEKSPLDEVHTKDVSLDLDSVMITMDGVQYKVLNEYYQKLTKLSGNLTLILYMEKTFSMRNWFRI